MSAPVFDDVTRAASRIAPLISNTPVVTSSLLNAWLGHTILFKAECLQRTGAFKLRGASNFLLARQEEGQLPAHIVANSSGNHAQAVAYVGAQLNCPVTIFAANSISDIKANATMDYGAQLRCYPTRPEADIAVVEAAEQPGVIWIPPFNHNDIIAGQGTVTLEALEQAQQMGANINAVFAPVGGGGLVSGALLAAKGINANIEVIGVEPTAANDASQSLQQGKIIALEQPPETLADGAATPSVGHITFELLQQLDGFYEAEEAQIIYWTQWLQHLLKLHIEPTCCMTMAGVAAWLSEQDSPQTVMVLLTGGNISASSMSKIYATDYLNHPPSLE